MNNVIKSLLRIARRLPDEYRLFADPDTSIQDQFDVSESEVVAL